MRFLTPADLQQLSCMGHICPALQLHCEGEEGELTKRPSQEMSRKSLLELITRPKPWFFTVILPICSVSAATVPATWQHTRPLSALPLSVHIRLCHLVSSPRERTCSARMVGA